MPSPSSLFEFSIIGRALTGEQEIKALETRGIRIDNYVHQMFLSEKPDGYNAQHRLMEGEKLHLKLLSPVTYKSRASVRGVESYQIFGRTKYRAGIIPRVCEVISEEKMREWRIDYIIVPHNLITDDSDGLHVFVFAHEGSGLWLRGFFGEERRIHPC